MVAEKSSYYVLTLPYLTALLAAAGLLELTSAKFLIIN